MAVLEGHKVITAHFTNNDRTVLDVLLREDGTGKIIPYPISASDNDVAFKELLKEMSLDELHEATFKYIRESQRDIKRIALNVAKRNGWITSDVNIDDDIGEKYSELKPGELDADEQEVQYVSKPLDEVLLSIVFNEEQSTDSLFQLKLKMFELEWVKDHPNRDVKRLIRKAQTTVELLKHTISLWETREESSSTNSE